MPGFKKRPQRGGPRPTEVEFEPLRWRYTVPQIVELAMMIATSTSAPSSTRCRRPEPGSLGFLPPRDAGPGCAPSVATVRGSRVAISTAHLGGSTSPPGARAGGGASRRRARGGLPTNSSRERESDRGAPRGWARAGGDGCSGPRPPGGGYLALRVGWAAVPLGTREMGEVLEAAGARWWHSEDWRWAGSAIGNDPLFDFGRLRAARRARMRTLATVNPTCCPRRRGEFDPGCGAPYEPSWWRAAHGPSWWAT